MIYIFFLSLFAHNPLQTPCVVGYHIEMNLEPIKSDLKKCNSPISAVIKWQSVVIKNVSGRSIIVEMPRIPVKIAVYGRYIIIALKKDGILVLYADCLMKIREVHKYKGYFSVEDFRFTGNSVVPLSGGVEICMDKRALEKYIAKNKPKSITDGSGIELVLGGAGLAGGELILQTTGFRMMFHIKGDHLAGLNVNAYVTENWGAVTAFSYRWKMGPWIYTDFMPALFFGTNENLSGGFVISPVAHLDFDALRIGVQISVGYGFFSPPQVFVSGAILFGLLL